WERGDLELARRSFRNLAFLEPDNGLVRWKLAQTLQRQGDFDAAEHELRTAISGNPENLEFRLRLGLLYAEKRQRVANAEEKQRAGFQAQRLLKEVLKSQPDNALAIAALQELNAK
ncbi:MAG TPA: tetratricopeptide repeat protein, partial [Myxococcaceae bacterium]|nr:tetratricopeptide repeat protein [Myxococcaceae bacterium]